QRSLPQWRFKEIGSQKAQAQERVKVAQAAASIHDLELVGAKINDIALKINRNVEETNELDAKLRGNQLKSPRQFGIDEVRERDCKNQKSDRDKGHTEQ